MTRQATHSIGQNSSMSRQLLDQCFLQWMDDIAPGMLEHPEGYEQPWMPVWRALYICLLKEGGFEREELEELSDVISFSEKVGSMSNDFQKLHKRLIKYLVLYVDTYRGLWLFSHDIQFSRQGVMSIIILYYF